MLSPTEIEAVEQQLASLRQHQSGLLIHFSRSHANLEKADELGQKLLPVATEIGAGGSR